VNLGFEDKVVLVTGAGGGMGRDMATAFAKEGAKVAVNDVSREGIEETLRLIKADNGIAQEARCDITDLGQVTTMITNIEKAWGKVDVLVNNAALLIAHEFYVDTKPEDCDKEIKVVLYGTMNCTRAVLPGMSSRQYGKVVNIVTDAARVGQERQVNYSAAKGGVISFTRSIAKEVGRNNINVNAVSPGATNSPMRREMLRQLVERVGEAKAAEREEKVRRAYAMRRIGEPEDIVAMVLFLSSERARHITGQTISVNGGFAMP
jgi:2-hydroxycyclohexanecarboxyl-CoA dehydrogenase